VGLSIDWGKLVWNAHQLQNAADAGALAGAMVVKEDPALAVQHTHNLARENRADRLPVTLQIPEPAQGDPLAGGESSYDILVGRWVTYDRTFVPTLDAPNAVKAVARRNGGANGPALALVFGPIFGTNTASAAREAVAWCNDSGGAGLICLSASAVPGFELSGTGSIDVQGGGIHVNSTAVGNNQSDGTYVGGSGTIDAGFINAVGGITPDADDAGAWADRAPAGISVRDYTDKVEPINDPVADTMQSRGDDYVVYNQSPYSASLDLPALIEDGTFPTYTNNGLPLDAANGEVIHVPPGYYPNGMHLQNGGTIKLEPTAESGVGTIFIFGGDSSNFVGLCATGGVLEGHGVTCYVTENFAAGTYGRVRLDGAAVDLYSPGDWQNYLAGKFTASLVEGLNGIAIWQDPTVNDGNPPEAILNGNADFHVYGTIYFPDPIHVQLNGTLEQAGCQIVCGSATVLGRADFTVPYDGRNNPGQSHRAFLVK
jgi:hypothetical protein